MAAAELIESRTFVDTTGEDSGERVYLSTVALGATDDETAFTEIAALAPLIWRGLKRSSIRVVPFSDSDTGTERLYKGTVGYTTIKAARPPLEIGESQYNFEVVGELINVKQSREHRYSAAHHPTAGQQELYDAIMETGDIEDTPRGAINIDKEGDVKGVDLLSPVPSFSETHVLAVATVNATYQRNLRSLVGTMNDDVFKGGAAGEILFIGASGTRRNEDDWEITYNFAESRNQVLDLDVGPLTVPENTKLGWDYLWTRFQEVVTADGKRVVSYPQSVHVERVYLFGDFSLLGIGT